MVTFLTGATGFIGGAILDRLCQTGGRVLALVRREEAARQVALKGAQPVLGDLLQPETYRAALHQADCVIHAAGVNAFCLNDPRPLYAVNVEGTRSLLEAAGQAGVTRIVYTSSALTIGEARGQVAHEETPHRGSFLSHYERSKYEGEQVALALARQGLPVVILNPSSVQGPGRVTGSARIFLDYLNGRLPVICGDCFSLVYVDDCVAAHLHAAEMGQAGQRYLVSGLPVSAGELLETLEAVTGLTQRPWRLPPALARAAGTVGEWDGRLRGKRPRLCRDFIRTLLHGARYDSGKAERELKLTFTPLREMVLRTVTWYARAGHVKRPLPRLASPVS